MFDKTLCISYAKQWAYSFNPRYYNFSNLGGDCTNFISQCLFAGGIPMNYLKYGWYYSTLQSRAPAWTGVNEFWHFGTTNQSVGLKLAPVNQEETQVADIVQLSNGNVFYHTVLI